MAERWKLTDAQAIAVYAGAALAALGMAAMLYEPYGQAPAVLSLVPLILGGVLFGQAVGASLGVLLSLANAATMARAGVLGAGDVATVQVALGVAIFALLGGFAGRVRDLDVRGQVAARSLEQQRATLQRELAQRQEYTDVLAHEMRNPLVAIRAAARAAGRDVTDPNAARRLAAIADEAGRALRLLDSLSDVSSLESGRMRSVLLPIDLVATIRGAVAGLGDLGRPVRLDLPSTPLRVQGDDTRLAQVISNLVTNAARYSPPDLPIEITAGLSADRSTAIVRIRDYGPGIPPGERERLFQKFARLTTAGGTGGSGLGLFISRGIMRDHNGELWAEFPPGGGTSFALSLPIREA